MRWAALLLVCACACATRHVGLQRGRADMLARWTVGEAVPVGGARLVIAGTLDGAPLVACLDGGDLAWRLTAATAGEHTVVRIAVADDGATWVLAQTRSSFGGDRRFLTEVRTALTRVDREGRVEREVPVDGLPYYVAAASGGDAIAVLGTPSGLRIVRAGRDGTVRYTRALERGVTRPPSDIGIRIVGALHGDTLWIAGAGTTLYVAMPQRPDVERSAMASDGTFQGPTVLAIAADTGELRRLHPLATRLGEPGGWDYPSGLAYARGKLVLARTGGSAGRVTVHDPKSLQLERTLFEVRTAELRSLAADGEHVLVGLRQADHASVTYGGRVVSTRTAPPTSVAAIAVRLSLAGGEPEVVTVASSRPATGDVGGSVAAPIAVPLQRDVAVLGTFDGDVLIDGRGPLTGIHGGRRECIEGDCRRRDWSVTSSYLVRVRRTP